jgi:hypothetical protein
MDAAVIDDFKQFIVATIVQHTSHLATEENLAQVRDEVAELRVELSGKIDQLSDDVAEELSQSNDAVDEQLKDHEVRLTQLEEKAV